MTLFQDLLWANCRGIPWEFKPISFARYRLRAGFTISFVFEITIESWEYERARKAIQPGDFDRFLRLFF